MFRSDYVVFVVALSGWSAPKFQPTFASKVNTREESLIRPLLKAACGDGVRTVTVKDQKALGCGDGSMDEILASRKRPATLPVDAVCPLES